MVKDEKDTTYIIKTNDTLKFVIKNNEIILKLNRDKYFGYFRYGWTWKINWSKWKND